MANRRRRLTGVVAKDKMDKTVVVEVTRTTIHPLYRKVMRVASRYMAHDEQNLARVGDEVAIVESRPVSKRKRWTLETVLVSASGSAVSAAEAEAEAEAASDINRHSDGSTKPQTRARSCLFVFWV
ncbi:MAG: 30S ribosomal protein S17 [Anaerolineales bacterium]|nr:30S ribosomal protein S17 [Anaerolineales bacterium]